MPPRRSSRSTRASVEPTSVETLPSKRKRGQTVDRDGMDTEEKENVAKPPSRARSGSSTRQSVAPSMKGRASTRSRASLHEVVETDEEKDVADSPPPVKKSRPSPEVEDSEEESWDEGIKAKGRRATSAKRSAPKKGRGTRVDSDADDAPSSRRGPAKRAGVVSATSKASTSSVRSRTSTRSVKLEDESADEEQSDDPMVVSSEEEDVKPVIKSRKSKSALPKSKARARAPPSNKQAEETVETVEDSDASGTEGKPAKAKANAETQSSDEENEIVTETITADNVDASEDEKSLFDAPPIPVPAPQPQTVPEEPKGPKSRLVIHKMALVNFKSYAGRQEIGPFHKSFSSIVGPNGSGKSNTIDALLFVFGYRASKMRQGKLSELIHNSARYPDLDDCSVEVHFREIIDLPGPDAFNVVPNSKLVVARQAFKNNTSRYTINSKTSNFTEVQTLLKGRGIDLDHKRFLILQGEVESIAQMKPKAPTEHEDGLLEYLEDIIGTSKYKEPIEEAMVEMEQLQEDRGDKLNRLRIVEKEKNALEDKKREAEDYLRLQNEHVRAQSRLWQWYLWKCLLNEEEFERKITKYEKELAEETERNKDDVTHLDMLKQHYEEREKAYEEVKAAAAEAVKDLAAHEKQEVGLQERRKHAAGKAKKLKKSLQDDTNAKTKAVRAVEDSSEKMEKEKLKVDEHEANLVNEEKILEGIRDSLKDKTQVFHDQIEVKQKELQPWTTKINTKQAEIDVASSERDALTKKAEGVREAGKEAHETLEKLQVDQEAKVTQQEQLKANKANLQKETRAAEKQLQDAQKNVQDCRSNASSSRQKVDEAKASQADNRSQNRVLDSLTRLKNAGRIQGFHGRLGSLGTIPDKYDVAISTACGALHHMVVDTVEQGQSCIEYLRSQNVGRASFIVLQKLPATDGLHKMTTPENVPRLFDLVQPKEPRFAPAFYKAIGNTLVAENMEQANRIAFGGQRRWRVVTLAGQVIDVSGTMSGGGTQPTRGAMSSKLAAETVRPEVLRTYEKESEEAVRHLDEAMQQARAAETELDRLIKSGPQIDIALEKLGLDVENGKRRIFEAQKRVRDLKSQSKPDAGDVARISTLEKEISSSTKELEDLQEKSGKIEKAIMDLEKKILEIGGAKLLTQKSKVDGIRLHINLANDEITKAEVAKAKAEKDSVKLNGSIEANTTALEEVDAELEDLNVQLQELVQYVTELQTKVEAAQSAAENSKEDLENLKAELDTKNEEIQAFRQHEMELKQLLSDAQKDSKENERTLDHWRMEHDKLRLEEIDEDDEDDDEEPEHGAEAIEPAEGKVKPEPGQETGGKAKDRDRTPSYELHIYSADELAKFKKREMVADTELLDEKLKNAKPNLSVLKEYRKREEEFFTRAKDLETITKLRDAQKQKYDGLRKQRLDEFMAGFSLISMKLKEMYQMITLGGNAELELVDSMDPFSEGIIFSVMPPKKSWKNISNLSGGEKTLSSLALVFALHVFKPTPLYFMDEIDAALDFRNVSIVANYIKDRTKNAQFIIISLRNDMFELSHRLIGIYKTANATQSISIDNHALTVSQ